ncbi:uncharacterized protein LOC118506176 [Anopheles stephensi]|uniref:Uncharacterized protein n=1 Tax=Anopheles stephensi TaxID=30069 RepID=A0A182Y1J1_ANOST|nr:uncharacterized protein LOC118506176 [Anopheles stephensi]
MFLLGSLVLLVSVTQRCVSEASASQFTYVEGNVSCTIINLTSDSDTKDYAFLTNNTEELVFNKASIDVLDLTKPLATIAPWKILISHSNVTRIIFPAQMSPSVVHLLEMNVDDVNFDENISLQDLRADYTSLQVISPTVSKLHALDILWVTHSQLANFSFDVLENSSVSLLYLVSNKIESVTISPGVVCCQSLEEIFLSDNLLTTLDLGTVALMSKLKTLFLENNKLTDLYANVPSANQTQMLHPGMEDERERAEFCSWRQYYISQEQTEEELSTPSCTDYFATLLSLHLARNNIVHVNFSIFSLMNNLNSLDLSKNRLIDLIAPDDAVPIRLSELFVSNNNITEVYLKPFVSMKAIYLYDNNVKGLNMSSLPDDLDYLNLINNPLNCEALPHLNRRSAIPVLGPYTEC